MTVAVPGPGQLFVTGPGVTVAETAAVKTVTQAGPINFLVKAFGKAREKLSKRGKVRVIVSFTFAPSGPGAAGSTYFVYLTLKKPV